jgi:hypothetical protein
MKILAEKLRAYFPGSTLFYLLLGLVLFTGIVLRLMGIDFPITYGPDQERVLALALGHVHTGDLNPHFFNYPSFYGYTLALVYGVFSGITGTPIPENVEPIMQTRLMLHYPLAELALPYYVVGRIFTVLFYSMGTIVLTYMIGKRLYGRWVGLLGALFLALTPLHVWNSHYIEVDVPLGFWIALAAYLAVRVYESPRPKWYIGAGVAAGLAAGTKYPGAIAMLMPMTALIMYELRERWQGGGIAGKIRSAFGFLSAEYFWGQLFWVGVAAAIAFVAVVPYAVFDNEEFLNDLRSELRHSQRGHYGADTSPRGIVYTQGLYYLLAGLPFSMGLPLYIAAVLGVLFALLNALIRRNPGDWMLLIFILAYYAVTGTSKLTFIRYMIPLLPYFGILAARLFQSLIHVKIKSLAYVGAALLAVVLIYTLAFDLSTNVKFTNDARTVAAEALHDLLPDGAKVAVAGPFVGYYPHIDKKWPDGKKINYIDCQQKDHTIILSLCDADAILLSSNIYVRPYRDPQLFIRPYNWFERMRNDETEYKRVAVFENDYLNRDFYTSLDIGFIGAASPRIEVYVRDGDG